MCVDYENKVDKKYESYKKLSNIAICRSDNNSSPTLEPQIVECNKLEILNKVLGKSFQDKKTMSDYMKTSKTECALKIFETQENITFPQYVEDAIK